MRTETTRCRFRFLALIEAIEKPRRGLIGAVVFSQQAVLAAGSGLHVSLVLLGKHGCLEHRAAGEVRLCNLDRCFGAPAPRVYTTGTGCASHESLGRPGVSKSAGEIEVSTSRNACSPRGSAQ